MSTTVILPKDRAHAERAARAVGKWYDQGGAVIDTDTLISWSKSRECRGLDRSFVRQYADPEGLHLISIVLLHNDDHWRVKAMMNAKGTNEPVDMIFDVSMELWDRAREGTKRNVEILTAAAETGEVPDKAGGR